jgi:CBS domain containing-hemolysin-like protein
MTHTYLGMISTSDIFKDYIPEEDDEDDENEDRKEELLTDLLNRFNSDKIH